MIPIQHSRVFSLIIVLLVFLSTDINAQNCLPSGITFSSQAQIDEFPMNYPMCSIIDGNVIISGNGITNIDSLYPLTSVNGFLHIDNNPMLNTLSGLNNLTSIGGSLFIHNNELVTSLSGLNALVTIVGPMIISENDALENFNGLNSLTSIIGDVTIDHNPSLVDLAALFSLTSINGNLAIRDNISLPTLTGLDNINHNTIINLYIEDNTNLSLCAILSICNYLPLGTIAYDVNISENSIGCASILEVETACQMPLPVRISHFSAQHLNNSIQLIWETSSEVNNFGFEIEHSLNMTDWVNIGFVNGQKTSSKIIEYNYLHNKPTTGINYYRLKQLDLDNSFKYSEIISVASKKDSKIITIYPNPTYDYLHIDLNKLDDSGTHPIVKICRIDGTTINEMILKNSITSFDIGNLAPGSYFLKLYMAQQVFEFQFIKL